MQIDRMQASATTPAPEPGFAGDVRIHGYFRREAPSRLAGATVVFAPGARTPWKINPLGQTLVVTEGVGWAQGEGGEIVEVRAGDVIWQPPGTRHWEGATPDEAMTCFAVQEEPDGEAVMFFETVSDEDYLRGRSTRSMSTD